MLALMTVLPDARNLFPRDAVFSHNGVEHLLLLQPEHAIPAAVVVNLLREVYHEVALATAAVGAGGAVSRPQRFSVRLGEMSGRLGSRISARPSSAIGESPLNAVAHDRHLRTDIRDVLRGEAGANVRCAAKVDEHGLLTLLETSLSQAKARRTWLARGAIAFALAYFLSFLPLALRGGEVFFASQIPIAIVCLCGVVGLAAAITPSRARVARLEAALAAGIGLFCVLAIANNMLLSGPALVRAPAEWLINEMEVRQAHALASAGALRVGSALSYAVLLILCGGGAFLAPALAALAWHARHACRTDRARAHPPPPSLSPAALKRALLAWCAICSSWVCAFAVWKLTVLATAGVALGSLVPELAVQAAAIVVSAALAVFCASRRVQLAVYAAAGECCRPPGYSGALLSLAPLLGFGAPDALPDAQALVALDERDFCAVIFRSSSPFHFFRSVFKIGFAFSWVVKVGAFHHGRKIDHACVGSTFPCPASSLPPPPSRPPRCSRSCGTRTRSSVAHASTSRRRSRPLRLTPRRRGLSSIASARSGSSSAAS
jgi:hypothetical protein